ncbi:MAG: hypothetical protein LBB59_04635 [Campylobacteraceae bacterium]|jgi:uncharacterized protein (UPF0335 family)|nr:hypothetical protein [Campylobacteraceae bacterium]
MKEKILTKIEKLDADIKKINNDFADILSEYIGEVKTEKGLECFRKFREILKRLNEL